VGSPPLRGGDQLSATVFPVTTTSKFCGGPGGAVCMSLAGGRDMAATRGGAGDPKATMRASGITSSNGDALMVNLSVTQVDDGRGELRAICSLESRFACIPRTQPFVGTSQQSEMALKLNR
jgi:hypothetical protein